MMSLAHQFGFDADAVWNDPKNATLQQLRTNPNILYPTDVLYIPDQTAPPTMNSLTPGTTNTFVSTAPQMTILVSLPAYPSASYSVDVNDTQTTGATDGSGQLTLSVPVDTSEIHLTFDASGDTTVLLVGHLDPVTETSGLSQRLTNLGFPTQDVDDDEGHGVRRMLAVFQVAAGLPPSGEFDADTGTALDREHGM
jgi:hypothetical protein